MIKISESWDNILKEEFTSPSYLALREFLKEEYFSRTIYPDMNNIFNSMKLTPFEKIKVVILGQDPYHEVGQAMGLSFSVPNGTIKPPSLVNIFKEIKQEFSLTEDIKNSDLTPWAKQGVLLLNTCLTVREHQANSHKGKGWEEFTDGIIKKISKEKENVVFLLWGANARSKRELIDRTKHLVFECAHPSPLSAYNGFFGCGHFKKTNEYLEKHNKEIINWSNL